MIDAFLKTMMLPWRQARRQRQKHVTFRQEGLLPFGQAKVTYQKPFARRVFLKGFYQGAQQQKIFAVATGNKMNAHKSSLFATDGDTAGARH